MLFAVNEKVLVGKNEHQAYVLYSCPGNKVVVRWESTKKEEEVDIADVKKIDLDAKRPTRGKRRKASGAEAPAPAPAREPPRKRRKKKKADAGAQDPPRAPKVIDEVSQDVREEIERHVKALHSRNDVSKELATAALRDLASRDAANRAAIARRLVALVANGAAGRQESAARALGMLAGDAANEAAIVAAGGIEALVALVRSGAAGGQEAAARALCYALDDFNGTNDDAYKVAIVAAGGVEALSALLANGPDLGRWYAQQALKELGPLGEYVSRLQSENASLKRRLGEEDVVSLRDGEAPLPAKESSALRDAHDKQQTAVLRRVKEEKADAEGARDRNDAVAAAASAAAATATADAREAAEDLEDAHELTGHLVQSENNKMSEIDELKRAVSERDSRIEALEAEARKKDATIAELRGRMGQLDDALAAVDAIRNRPRV